MPEQDLTSPHHLTPVDLDRYVQGTVSGEEIRRLDEHLAHCAACRQALENAQVRERFLEELKKVCPPGGAGADTGETLRPLEDLARWLPLAPPRSPDYIGRFGSYDVVRVLGRGGMGIVLKCYEESLNRMVALKVMRRELSTDAAAVQRFFREARAAAQLHHPNIVTIHAVGRVEDTSFIAMEYIKGATVGDVIDREGAVASDRIVRIGSQVADALAYAHRQGIIHRDVKPSNILLENDIERVVLTDFGLARGLADATRITHPGTIVGTPCYMSPEQAEGKATDHRSDIFSLGSVLYEMASGKRPFQADSIAALMRQIVDTPARPIRQINPDVPDWLCAIIDRAMAKNPTDRYQNAGDLADDLRAHQGPPRLRPPILLRVAQDTRNLFGRRSVRWGGLFTAVAALGLAAMLWMSPTPSVPFTRFPATQRDMVPPRAPSGVPVAVHAPRTQPSSVTGDGLTLRLEGWIETGGTIGNGGIALSPDGSKLYVAHWGGAIGAPVEEYRLSDGQRLRVFPFDNRSCHGDVAISNDGRFLFVPNYYFTHISRLDLADHGRETRFEVWQKREAVWAWNLALSPDGRLLAVAVGQDGRNYDMKNDQIALLEVSDGAISRVAEVPLPDEPQFRSKMGFTPDSRCLYVNSHPRQSTHARLYEIRLGAPFRIARSLEFPDGLLTSVVVHPSGDRLYVSDGQNKKIWAVRQPELTIESSFDLEGAEPGSLAVAPGGELLFAVSPTVRALWAIDTATHRPIACLRGLRKAPGDVEVSPDSRVVYVSHGAEEGGVAVIGVYRRPMPIGDGRIIFASDREGNFQIYAMDAAGGEVRRLTRNNASERSPRWSPDGRQIAFISDRFGKARVCVMDESGRGGRPLEKSDPALPFSDLGGQLDWSPDGSRIAFVSADLRAIRVIGVDGTGLNTLVQGTLGKGYSHFHHVGWKWQENAVYFSAQHPDSGYMCDVFAVNPDTGEVRQITDGAGKTIMCQAPFLSPTGTLGTLRCEGIDPADWEVVVLDESGQVKRHLTRSRLVEAAPRWSHDGQRIVFSAGTVTKKHLWIMNADGTGQKPLTFGDGTDIEPDMR